MASDLDRRCEAQVKQLEQRIERIGDFLNKRRSRLSKASLARLNEIRDYRNYLIVDLYEMKRSHAAYDEALERAREDPTGQDVDAFYSQYSEHDEPIRWED